MKDLSPEQWEDLRRGKWQEPPTFVLEDSPYVRTLEADNRRFREALREIHETSRGAERGYSNLVGTYLDKLQAMHDRSRQILNRIQDTSKLALGYREDNSP